MTPIESRAAWRTHQAAVDGARKSLQCGAWLA